MMTGEFRAALDEKGRLLIPTKLRSEITGDTVVLTKGIDRCLWLFSTPKWEVISKTVQESVGMFAQRDLMIQRRIIGSAMELDVDKAGRVGISSLLREHLTPFSRPSGLESGRYSASRKGYRRSTCFPSWRSSGRRGRG